MKLLNHFLELWREAKEKLMGNNPKDPQKPNEQPQQPTEGTPATPHGKTEPATEQPKPTEPSTDTGKQ